VQELDFLLVLVLDFVLELV
jgi:hypothetical protein